MLRLLPLVAVLVAGLTAARPSLAPPVLPADPTAGIGWVLTRDVGKGTGWILDVNKRWLVTCWHVVGDNDTVEVVFPKRAEGRLETRRAWYLEHMPRLRAEKQVVKGKVLHREIGVDLALIELESLPEGVIALPIAGDSPRPGDPVHGVGNRYDVNLLWIRSRGWVRQVRKLKEGYFSAGKQVAEGAWIVEARVPINEGDSGGPLLDVHGCVVGTAAAVAWEAQGSGYFIDGRELRAFLTRAGKMLPVGEEHPHPPPVQPAPRDLYKRLLPATVLVVPEGTKRRAAGWIVDRARRFVLTGADVLGERKAAAIRFPFADAKPALGVVLARDPQRNLALLELDSLPKEAGTATFADELPLPGDPLHGITHAARPELDWLYLGTSLRQIGPAKIGREAGPANIGREVGPANIGREEDDQPTVLLLQAQPAEGEEGAPIVDNRGRIVGQHTGKGPPQQQIAYALALPEVKGFLARQRALLQPSRAEDWLARARLFREAKAAALALRDLGRALEVDPTFALACSERAGLQQQRGDLDAALADAERALRLDPKLVSAWCSRAEARAARGALKDALADTDQAMLLDRLFAEAQRVRALVLRRLGRLPEALAHADEAIWLDRKSARAYRERGWIHLERDDPARALEDLDQALRLDEDDALTYRLRGEAKLARHDMRGARADFEAALRRTPEDARAWLGLGRTSGEVGDFTRALAREPNLAPAYLERGDLRLRGLAPGAGLGDLAEAVRLQPALREAALARVRRAVRELETTNPTLAGRLLLGAEARLVVRLSGRLWWDLDPDPARRVAQLQSRME